MDLTSKIILDTSGGSGIGRKRMGQLVALDNMDIICGRDDGKLAEAACVTGTQAIAGDAMVAKDQERIQSDIQVQHGRLDLPIDTAGIFPASDLKTDPDILKTIKPADLVREILEGLRRHKPTMLLERSRQINWMSRIPAAFRFRQFAKPEFH